MISVLYVDDEQDLLDLGKIFLEQSGDFTVSLMCSAQDALDHLTTVHYDAIISDYQMPGMDGLQFLREIRARHGPVPFILFTGRGREEVVIEAINHGVDFYLQKGGNPEAQFAELALKIRQAVQRRKVETRLSESEANLQAIVENTHEIIASYDLDLRLIVYNRACAGIYRKMFGVELYPGLRTLDLFPGPMRDFWMQNNKRALAGESFSVEFSCPSPDGHERVFEIFYNPIRKDGKFSGFSTLTRDITARKKAEDELRLLKISVDRSSDEVFWLDFCGSILYVNDAACRISGYSREELLSMKIHALDPDYSPEVWERSVADLRERKTQFITTRHRKKDGTIIHVEIVAIYVNHDTREYSFAFVRDITARRQAEDELRAAYEQITASEEELRAQFDALGNSQEELRKQKEQLSEIASMIPGVVYQFYVMPDGNMGLHYISSRAGEIFGFAGDTPTFLEWFTAHIHPGDRDAFLASIDRVVRAESSWEFEGRFIKPSGESIWFQGLSRPVRHGPELIFNGVLLDITKRKGADGERCQDNR